MACIKIYYPHFYCQEDILDPCRYVEGLYNLYQQDLEFKNIIQQFFSVVYATPGERERKIEFFGITPISENFLFTLDGYRSSDGYDHLNWTTRQGNTNLQSFDLRNYSGSLMIMKPKNGGLFLKIRTGGQDDELNAYILITRVKTGNLIKYSMIYPDRNWDFLSYTSHYIYNENVYNFLQDIYYKTPYMYNADFINTSDNYILYPYEIQDKEFLDIYTYDYGREIPPNTFIEVDNRLFYSFLLPSNGKKVNILLEIDTSNEWEVIV